MDRLIRSGLIPLPDEPAFFNCRYDLGASPFAPLVYFHDQIPALAEPLVKRAPKYLKFGTFNIHLADIDNRIAKIAFTEVVESSAFDLVLALSRRRAFIVINAVGNASRAEPYSNYFVLTTKRSVNTYNFAT